jgi:putative AdoMet-dependent methyltransferase
VKEKVMDQAWFDQWASDYDADVVESDKAGSFPFAGYLRLMNEVFEIVNATPRSKVLDLGFGTGVLTQKFYEAGHVVTGVDFSEKMCAIAGERMPGARLICADFAEGLPASLHGETFDAIVSTYAFHHILERQKARRIRELMKALKPGGTIVIGDISFANKADKDYCEQTFSDLWDEQESYIVFEDLLAEIEDLKPCFKKISVCAGILTISI